MNNIPNKIHGWLTDGEWRALRDMAIYRTVLELGAYKGRSTVAMASHAKLVHSVDWHRGNPGVDHDETLGELWSNLKMHGALDKVVIHVGRFEDVLPAMTAHYFDFCFVDGTHSEEAVVRDIGLTTRLLKQGERRWAFHDYACGAWPGVRMAVDAMLPGHRFKRRLVDSMLIVEESPCPS